MWFASSGCFGVHLLSRNDGWTHQDFASTDLWCILARRELDGDLASMQQHGIASIDLVVVNLYPFRETIAKPM